MRKGKKMADNQTFEIIFEANAVAVGKMRNDIEVSWPKMQETFSLATDEGAFHGGDGTAPPPLALFAAALCGCLMTQIRAFAKRMRLSLDGLQLSSKFHWQGETTPSNVYETQPVEFEIIIHIESSNDQEGIIELITAAKLGCFIEQSLSKDFPIKHYVVHNGESIEI